MLFNSVFTIFWDFNIQCRVCYTACSVNRRETVSRFKFPIISLMIPFELNWPVSLIIIYILYVIITHLKETMWIFCTCVHLINHPYTYFGDDRKIHFKMVSAQHFINESPDAGMDYREVQFIFLLIIQMYLSSEFSSPKSFGQMLFNFCTKLFGHYK